MPISKKRRCLKQFALLGITLFVAFVGLELVYRVYTHLKYRRTVANFSHELYVLQPGDPIAYTLKPNAKRTNKIPGYDAGDWSYELNADGFRTPLPGPKNPEVRRILVIGDSYAFGWGLDESLDPFPRALEKMLNDDAGTTTTQVINAGTPGYNTVQEARLLQRLLPKYEPDAVILAYVMNDAEPQFSVQPSPEVLYRYTRFWLPARVKEAMNQAFFGGEHVLHVNKHMYRFDYSPGFAADSPKRRESREALERMAALCRKRDIPFYLFIIPDFANPFGDAYPYRPIHETVSTWGKDLKIPTFDLWPVFQGRDSAELRIPVDFHPNAEAHRMLAKAIAERISD